MIAPLAVELLLVEDNPQDLELALRALRKAHLANRIEVARDGAEALDYIFAEGPHAGRNIADTPKVILLDLKLPKVDGLDVLRRIKGDVFEGTKRRGRKLSARREQLHRETGGLRGFLPGRARSGPLLAHPQPTADGARLTTRPSHR